MTEVAPGVWAEEFADFEVASIEGFTGHLRFEAAWGGYRCTGLELESVGDSPLTSEKLREIPIGRIAGELLRKNALTFDPEDDLPLVNPTAQGEIPATVLATWPNGDTRQLLSRVGFVYQLAEALGEYPTAAVQKATGKSRATASRMVAAAREQGYIRERGEQNIG